jgi:DNA-binding ferritin-like protein
MQTQRGYKMQELIKSLQQFQANSIVYYNLVRGFFWNTESVLMRQSRIVYEDIYTQAEKDAEQTSIWLRRIGGEALYTLEEYAANQTLGNVKPDTYCGVEMAIHLVPINKKIIDQIKDLIKQANKNEEFGLVQHLSERLTKHQDWNWFLESSLKLPPNPWKSLKD